MQLLGLRVVKHMQNHLAANDMHGAAAVFEMKWLNDKKKEWTKEQEHVWRKYVKAERWGNKEKTSVLEENVICFYTHTHTHEKHFFFQSILV